MKKAVFIINSLQNGGAERVVATQAEYLRKQGVDVTLICLRRWIQYEVHPDIHIVCLSGQREFSAGSYLAGLVCLRRRLKRTLDRVTAGGELILLTSNLLYPDVLTRLTRYAKRAVYVLHAHQDIVPGAGNPLYKLFIRWLYGGRRVIAVGNGIAGELCGVYHLKRQMIREVSNPIDFGEIDRLKEEELKFAGPFILFCGRLSPMKCPQRAVKAFYQGGFFRRYSLVMLGIGELEDSLRQMVKDLGIESRVYFAGWERNPYKWMARADLLVLTSDSEGLSMVLLEALYCGCPAVSVKSPGPAQILTGELSRYLCGPSASSIVSVMKDALASYPDRLQTYTKEYSVSRNVENYLKIYREWNEMQR